MQMKTMCEVLCVVAIISTMLFGETMDIQLRIYQGEEKIITHDHLVQIKQFILQKGQRETYSNMYNDNPAYHTKGFCFYLNPDSGQENINCDLAKSDFNSLTIRLRVGGQNQYRTVKFLDKQYIKIIVTAPTSDLTVKQILQFVEDALQEILCDIEKK